MKRIFVFITVVHYQDSLQPEAPEELPERSRPDVCRSHTGKPPCTSATATFGASPAQATTDDEVSLLRSRGSRATRLWAGTGIVDTRLMYI